MRAHLQSQRSLWTSWTPGLSDHRLVQATDPAFLSWLGLSQQPHTMVMVGEGLTRRPGASGKNKKKKGQWARAAMCTPPPGVKIFISETKQLSYSITKRKSISFTKRAGAKLVCRYPASCIRDNLQLYQKIKCSTNNFKMPAWPVICLAPGGSPDLLHTR